MEITWNMRFKMFLAALVINVLGIILAMLLFYHYAAEHFYSEYAASLYERVYLGVKLAAKCNVSHTFFVSVKESMQRKTL